jgi:hypothetical protein
MMSIAAARAAAAYAPPYRSSVALWLDLTSPDTSIVSGAVATLGDRSGNGRHFTQALDTNRPAYTASDVDFGGRPSMAFDGTDDFLRRTGLPAWPQHTVAIVGRGGGSGKRYFAYGGATGGAVLVQQDTSTLLQAGYFNAASSSKVMATIAGATRTAIAAFDTSVGATAIPEVYVNGVDQGGVYAATAASNGPISGSPIGVLGASPAGTAAFFDGSIAEAIFYNRALSGAEIAVVDAWLAARYSL